MRYSSRVVFVGLAALLILHCKADSQPQPLTPPPTATYPSPPDTQIRNIILFIGDGMGISHITAGRLKSLGANGRLHIDRMPVTGLLINHAADNLITDSAAGATALASGFKTNNAMISLLPDNTRAVTILEALREKGFAAGLVATSSITHATPACFAAHVPARKMEPEIAAQLVESGVEVMLGGGRAFFIPEEDSASKRSDDLNLIERARQNGYRVVQNREELQKISEGRVLGLFNDDEMRNEPHEPTLAEMAAKAIELLRGNANGFFLMVEGSQIDWGAHDNLLDYVVREMLAFDEAVKVGLEFAREDRRTLVLVTADHETGGLAINDGSLDGKELEAGWTSGHHTGQPVPIFGYGPHSLRFTGVHDNTRVPIILAELFGVEPFPRIRRE
ncbi:MAG: alkaline phosphatase [Calditrichaceae bacterium]|nr:alkaline phosphatase [Calditrichaceae bacterium]